MRRSQIGTPSQSLPAPSPRLLHIAAERITSSMSSIFRRRLLASVPRLLRAAERPAALEATSLALGRALFDGAAPRAASPACLAAVRAFRGTAAVRETLADVLRNEIEYEKQRYEQPEVSGLAVRHHRRRRQPVCC